MGIALRTQLSKAEFGGSAAALRVYLPPSPDRPNYRPSSNCLTTTLTN